jgi:hypothetical protein
MKKTAFDSKPFIQLKTDKFVSFGSKKDCQIL